jgi:hypothetical protein
LEDCRIEQDSFLQLSQLSGLTALRLGEVVVCTAGWKAPARPSRVTDAVTAILQQLQGLHQLQLLKGVVLDDRSYALAPLSTMQHLQHVTLSTDACQDGGSNLEHLPACLTHLKLYKGTEPADLHVYAGKLPQLPALRELQLANVTLHAPSVFSE